MKEQFEKLIAKWRDGANSARLVVGRNERGEQFDGPPYVTNCRMQAEVFSQCARELEELLKERRMERMDDLRSELKAMEKIAKILHELPSPDSLIRVSNWLQKVTLPDTFEEPRVSIASIPVVRSPLPPKMQPQNHINPLGAGCQAAQEQAPNAEVVPVTAPAPETAPAAPEGGQGF